MDEPTVALGSEDEEKSFVVELGSGVDRVGEKRRVSAIAWEQRGQSLRLESRGEFQKRMHLGAL